MRSNNFLSALPLLPLAATLILLLWTGNSLAQQIAGHQTTTDCNECQQSYYNDCIPNPDKNGQPCGAGKICCNGQCIEPCDCKSLNSIWKADTAPTLYIDNAKIETPSGAVTRGTDFNLVIKYDVKPYDTTVLCKCSHDKSKTEQGTIVSITPSTGQSDQGRHFAGYGRTVTIRGIIHPQPVTVTVRCPSSNEDQVFEDVKPHHLPYKAVIDTKNRPRRQDDNDGGGAGGGSPSKTPAPTGNHIPQPTPSPPAPTPTPQNCDEFDCSGAQPFQHIHAPLYNKPFTPSPNPQPTPTPTLAPGLNVRFETRGNSYWRPGWREFCEPNRPCNTNTDTFLTTTSSRTVSGCNKGCVEYTHIKRFEIAPSTNRYTDKISGCHGCGYSGLWLDEIITPTRRTQISRHSFSTHTYTTQLSDPFTTEDFLALGPKYLHDWKSQIDFAVPVERFNSGGWWWGYGYGHYHSSYYGINNRYQGSGVVVASQRLGRYQYPDGSRYENWLTYSESRLQFEWGPTNDPNKPGPLEDAKQRYGVTYLVVYFPDDNPFTPDTDESQDIEVLQTYTWDGKSQKSQIKTFSPQDLIPNKTGIVALLPVDIDIIHPATGELEENKEDIDDGGYVAIKRKANDPDDPNGDEDLSPVTRLFIHAIKGAHSNSKIRIKFDAGSGIKQRYKVYSDAARTQEVNSESTEFDATQETILYLQGLKKSESRGGEEITMQVGIGGQWSDGDSVKLTVVAAVFDFQLKMWIREQWIDVPFHPIDNLFNDRIAGGDDRDFNLDPKASFRLSQKVSLVPFKELDVDGVYDGSDQNLPGTSTLYKRDTSIPFPDRKNYDSTNRFLATASPVKTATPDASRTGIKANTRSNDKIVVIRLHGQANDPLIFGSCDIDWNFNVSVDASDPLNPKYEITGAHDDYPSFEIDLESVTVRKRVYGYLHPLPSDVFTLCDFGQNDDNVDDIKVPSTTKGPVE